VNEPVGTPVILVVDEDVGFLWWLGELFHEAGFRSIPALNCQQALALSRTVPGGVDLLVINPALKGVSGLIQSLTGAHPPKIVLIEEAGAAPIPGVQALATLERPSGPEPVSRAEWRQKIAKILSQVGFRAAS
jgi:DNA-binding NtrC family response regulator